MGQGDNNTKGDGIKTPLSFFSSRNSCPLGQRHCWSGILFTRSCQDNTVHKADTDLLFQGWGTGAGSPECNLKTPYQQQMLASQIWPAIGIYKCLHLVFFLKRDTDPAHVTPFRRRRGGRRRRKERGVEVGERRRGGGEEGGTRTNLSGLWLSMDTPQCAQVGLLYQEVKIGTGISSSFRTEGCRCLMQP